MEDDDLFVACSDGFWDQVEAGEIANQVQNQSDLNQAARALVALAEERGGPGGDNITLALARWKAAKNGLWNRLRNGR